MPSSNNFTRADSWFEKGKGETDCFASFIYYWIAFNALYYNNAGGERSQIKRFVENEYNNAFDNAFDSILELPAVAIFKAPIVNLHPPRSRSSSRVNTSTEAAIVADGSKTSAERLVNLMLCVYQARCNLFHGEKGANDYRDQEIANAASNVMKEFLTIYFGGQQNGQTSIH